MNRNLNIVLMLLMIIIVRLKNVIDKLRMEVKVLEMMMIRLEIWGVGIHRGRDSWLELKLRFRDWLHCIRRFRDIRKNLVMRLVGIIMDVINTTLLTTTKTTNTITTNSQPHQMHSSHTWNKYLDKHQIKTYVQDSQVQL